MAAKKQHHKQEEGKAKKGASFDSLLLPNTQHTHTHTHTTEEHKKSKEEKKRQQQQAVRRRTRAMGGGGLFGFQCERVTVCVRREEKTREEKTREEKRREDT